MGTTLGTLSNLAIYIGLVVLGAFLGSRKALRSRPLVWVSKLQFVALMILIVTLGVNLGANDEERAYLMSKMFPSMITGGFITVTITSVIIAGQFAKLL